MQKCSECKKNNVVEIEYGYPADMDEWSKKVDRGEIIPGGCCIGPSSPRWHCKDCGYEWGKVEY